MTRRVVVTGCGVVSSLGCSPVDFSIGLWKGRSGIRLLENGADDMPFECAAACLPAQAAKEFQAPELSVFDPATRYALHAAREAIKQSGLLEETRFHERCGIYLGSGLGSAHSVEEMYRDVYQRSRPPRPVSVVSMMSNAPAVQMSIKFDLRGPNIAFAAGCASSAIAIGEAFAAVRCGRLDYAMAGGAESCLTPGVLQAWHSTGALAAVNSHNPGATCRPFSRDRSGLVLGEGAAMFVLESLETALRRDASILCEVLGYGASADAVHVTVPRIEGQALAMSAALRDARLEPTDIDYINAHATGTRAGDIAETRAIKAVFGETSRPPVSSTKSSHGHLLGAAGALGFAAGLMAMRNGFLPATLHLREHDPECDLDCVPNEPRIGVRIERFMSNAFAFGGSNAVLIAGAMPEVHPPFLLKRSFLRESAAFRPLFA